MKKRHEELARSEFEDWLRDRFPGQDILWTEPLEPRPDWYLSLNGTKYAVEATSVVPTVKQGKSYVLEPSIFAGIGDFVDAIQQQALDEGILHGAYAIVLGPIPGNGALRRKITSRVLNFARTTKNQPQADPVTIGHVGGYDITIQKLSPGGNYLAELIDLGTRSDEEVNEDFQLKLKASVERKASRYESFSTPVILLILDGFHILDAGNWLKTASSIQAISTFEAVFRIKPANPPLLLAARSNVWLRTKRGNKPAD